MTEEKINSSLSMKRIVISIAIFFGIPLFTMFLNRFTQDSTISQTFAINLAGCILIMYDWNLFGLHYNRSKSNPGTTVLYVLIGCLFIGAWTWLGKNWLQCYLVLPEKSSIAATPIASVAIYLAYSYILAAIVNICFKCLTDHMDVHSKEIIVILASGFLFGFCYTLAFAPFSLAIWILTYLYNVILICFLSYLYNQTSSFIPGILSMGTVMLLFMLFL